MGEREIMAPASSGIFPSGQPITLTTLNNVNL